MSEERRIFSVELRASQSGKKMTVGGYAAKYNVRSHMLKGGFKERVMRGAFDSAIKRGDDVVATFNHSKDAILGRTSSGTLTLRSDNVGLRFDCDLPDTQIGRDTYTLVQRGDLNSCSFGFLGTTDSWDTEDDFDDDAISARVAVRSITNFRKIDDISIVASPAYPNTEVSARWNIVPAEVRSKAFLTGRSKVIPSDRELLAAQLREVTYWAAQTEKIQAPHRIVARRKRLLNECI